MSSLFANIRTAPEIAAYFGVKEVPPVSVPTETVEGTTGLIVVERDGPRLLKALP